MAGGVLWILPNVQRLGAVIVEPSEDSPIVAPGQPFIGHRIVPVKYVIENLVGPVLIIDHGSARPLAAAIERRVVLRKFSRVAALVLNANGHSGDMTHFSVHLSGIGPLHRVRYGIRLVITPTGSLRHLLGKRRESRKFVGIAKGGS